MHLFEKVTINAGDTLDNTFQCSRKKNKLPEDPHDAGVGMKSMSKLENVVSIILSQGGVINLSYQSRTGSYIF